MKKQLFTLVMMIALVIVAGSAMGQTANVPWEGSVFTYTAEGLTANAGDDVEFVLTPIASTLPTENPIAVAGSAGAGTWYAAATSFTNITATTQSITITWGSDAAINEVVGNDYKLWVVITDGAASGCSNYRYLEIDPRPNTFNLAIEAVGSGDASNTDLVLASTDAPGEECLIPSKLINKNYAAGSASNGSTYVYFRITRTSPLATYNWSYDLVITGVDDKEAIQFSFDGSAWGTEPFDATDQTISATDNEVYVRVLIPAITDSRTISATISDQKLGSFANVSDIDGADDIEASYIINPLPAIGGFSGL